MTLDRVLKREVLGRKGGKAGGETLQRPDVPTLLGTGKVGCLVRGKQRGTKL